MNTIDIIIDWTLCDGHGLCSRILPERISLDEWGYPSLDPTELGQDSRRAADLAARSCPALALRVVPTRRAG